MQNIQKNKTSFYRYHGKRALDLILVIPALMLLFPVFLVTSILIRLDSPGPAIFCQERVGQNRALFKIYKFRSMRVGAQAGGGSTGENDDRVTRVGKHIRRLSVDELPQLWNILKGDMSIVGPRPGLEEHLSRYIQEYAEEALSVKPGLTGLAQVNGRSKISLEEKMFFDIKYAKELSFLMDINIILNTVKLVLLRKNTN